MDAEKIISFKNYKEGSFNIFCDIWNALEKELEDNNKTFFLDLDDDTITIFIDFIA